MSVVVVFIGLLMTPFQNIGAATFDMTFTGDAQGSSTVFSVGNGGDEYVVNLTINLPDGDGDTYKFSSFGVELGKQGSHTQDLIMSLFDSSGLMESQTYTSAEYGVLTGSANTAVTLTFTNPQTLSNGTFSVVFSAPTLGSQQWFKFAAIEALTVTGDGGNVGDIGTADVTAGQSDTVSPVPEPYEYALMAGCGLLAFGIFRRRNQHPNMA